MSLLSTRPFLNSLRSLSPKSSFFQPTPTSTSKQKKNLCDTVSACRARRSDRSTQAKTSSAQDLCGLQLLPMYVPSVLFPIPTGRQGKGRARWPVARRALPPCLPRPQLVEQSLISFLARKLKCDGGKPQCQQCIRRKVVCEYDTNVKRRGLARSTQNPEDPQGIDVRERPLVNPKAVACQFCRSKPTLAFSRYTSTTLLMISNHPFVSLSLVLASRSQDKM